MPVVLLVRHGRTGANASGTLAGRAPGIALDERGEAQVRRLRERLDDVGLARIVSSPLQRCLQTARILGVDEENESQSVRRRRDGRQQHEDHHVTDEHEVTDADEHNVHTDQRLIECEYGEWTGRPLSELRRVKLWRVVQEHPSGAVFPGGESLAAMQARAVEAIRDHDAQVAQSHGPNAVWMAVSHGDVIKSVAADALGMHLDHFQRLVVDPASVTVISYTERRPFLLRLNDTGEDLKQLAPTRRRRNRRPSSDAAVGGGAGRDDAG